MTWPLSQDYNEAIQNPRTNFSDPDLQRGEAATNSLGLPMPYSGNFADVYQVRCPDGSRWAVKCFTREAPGLRERYCEISRWLRQANLPFTVDFTYLDQGIRVAGKWYPVLKMQWVEGQTFNQFVSRHLDKPAMMGALYQVWGRMAARLRASDIGHCDLQHGNVLLVPGASANSLALKLIDYDGMWVPALAESKSGEVGHPSYQHPRRLREGTYSIDVDRFPVLLIAAALRALKTGGRALWDRYDNGDNLLFREIDLRDPDESTLFERLRTFRDPTTAQLTDALLTALQGEVESAPLLEEVLASTHSAPAPASAVTTQRTPPPIASIAALAEDEPPDYDDPPSRAPSQRKKRFRKKKRTRLPVAALVGGAATFAVVVLTFGIVALLAFGARPKEQGTENRVVQHDPVTPAPRDPPRKDPAPPPALDPLPGPGPLILPPHNDPDPAAPVEPNPAPPPAVNPMPDKQPPPPATDFPGLISYWPFDEGKGNITADLAQGKSPWRVNGVDWVDGVRGKAIAFPGRGSCFLFGGGLLNFGSGESFTIAGWLQTTSTTHAAFLSMRRSQDDSALIAIDVEKDGAMGFFVRPDRQPNALAHLVAANAAVNDGQWHHFALVRRIGADVEAYVDGGLQAHTPAAAASGPITTDLRSIAVELYNVKNPPLQYIGAVDEFCVFGRALTADEIRKLAGR